MTPPLPAMQNLPRYNKHSPRFTVLFALTKYPYSRKPLTTWKGTGPSLVP